MDFPSSILMTRTKPSKASVLREIFMTPLFASRELNNRSLFHFIEYFWPEISTHPFKPNWHIEYLCHELEDIAYRVGDRKEKVHDLLINVPPGTTKTITCSIMFPIWCWTKWYWMKFITASYSEKLSLESADYSRDLIRSDRFQKMYPELDIRLDKDTKSNFRIVKYEDSAGGVGKERKMKHGGNRYSTSVGGTLTGFHGDIIIWDDPLNPTESVSEKELASTIRWIDETLPTRKTDKENSVIIGIMQRLHQGDPTGHILGKKKTNLKHICLPGEIKNFDYKVNPPELKEKYIDGLLDIHRLTWKSLDDLKADLGQYGYAGQIGQDPTPPGGGMFKTDHIQVISTVAMEDFRKYITQSVRYWDKAGTTGKGAWTVGVLMHKLTNGKFIVEDVKRGQWASEERERVIKATAEVDGKRVSIYMEQEPGSGGKDSVQASIRGLAGWAVYADRPTGDKAFRADPFSVQVNNDNVMIVNSAWNVLYLEELRFFPYSTFKDQVDASSGAFTKLNEKKIARRIT